MPPPVLLTRPPAQGTRFANLLRDRFGVRVRVVFSPLIAPRFLTPSLPADLCSDLGGVIFTSETGVEAFARLWRGAPLPAWCVGDRTAAAAQAAGFDARSSQGDATALVAALVAAPPAGPLLHARGRDATGDVAGALNRQGLLVAEAIVYAQIAQPLTVEARALLEGGRPVAVPLFSPRTARLLVQALPGDQPHAPLWVAALSPAVSRSAAPLAPVRLAVAPSPDTAGMIAALTELGWGTAQP